MKKKIVAGNWKMNKAFQEADDLIYDIVKLVDNNGAKGVEIVICPPFPYLELATDITENESVFIGAQNVSNQESGAFTGEISAMMLNSIEVKYCIVGHSERRKYFNESNHLLAEKADICLNNGIIPIFCCGEVLEERNNGNHFDVVKSQIVESLFHLESKEFKRVVIAYEPVWAIGTGVTATTEQAQEMHAFIRKLIEEKYNKGIANDTSILYGGSCNPQNAKELFANPDVDGGLIGGASLKADDFYKIIENLL
jgi:triosephosphate isomerase